MGETIGTRQLWRVLTRLLVVSMLGGHLVLSAAAVDSAGAQAANLRINEVVSSNDELLASDGTSPDWIELFNSGDTSIDLTNWALSDDPNRPQKWVFPAGTTIAAGGFTVVFASGTGVALGAELHTNFSLSGDETVHLVDPSATITNALSLPDPLLTDNSWGITSSGAPGWYTDPTPGTTNGVAAAGLLADVALSPERGFFTQPVNVTMTAPANATIRYTLDGSAPSADRGTIYNGPVPISSTAILRAWATAPGWTSPAPVTHTYIFPGDVPDQGRMQAPLVAANRQAVIDGLTSLPVVSLVSETSPGAPRFTFPSTNVATTVEIIQPDGSPGIQVDGATKEVGGHSVGYAKDSLRLVFDTEWGESSLDYPVFDGADNDVVPATDSFKRLTLRMGAHDTGFYRAGTAPHRSYIRARLHDEIMLDSGHTNSHGRYVNVFLNGEYWGQYHLREHFDDHFMAAYEGGDNSDYVGINRGAVAAGTGTSWQSLNAASTTWSEFSQWVDAAAYVDWMLVTEYGANTWDLRISQNWRGAGPADTKDQGQYIFQSSDTDIAMVSTTAQSPFPGPAASWTRLIAEGDPEFKTLVNDRIHALLVANGGALTSAEMAIRVDRIAAQINQSMWSEGARWNTLSRTEWETSIGFLRDTIGGTRDENLVANLAARGLTSSVVVPDLGPGGDVLSHTSVNIGNPNGAGTIWATLDGTDPRLPGGSISPSATQLSGSLEIDHHMTVSARVRVGNVWSALATVDYSAIVAPGAPELDEVPDLTDLAGFTTGYAIDAVDPADAALTFSATDLPAGLAIDSATGVISGTPQTVGSSFVVVTVDNGARQASAGFTWQVLAGPNPGTTWPVALNEFNAVQASESLGDGAVDPAFGPMLGNGGDWFELVISDDDTDLRGWTVELSSRKGDEKLNVDDTFVFGQAPVLSNLRAGTIITIAEDGLEDLSYDPDNGDWHIAAIARTGFDSGLLAEHSDFDTNRHEFRVRLLDAAGTARSPHMGETDWWDSVEGNVSGTETMALCTPPAPDLDPIGVYADVKGSSFGTANSCDGEAQNLVFLRGDLPLGDVNCDLTVDLSDAQRLLDALVGNRQAAQRCPLDDVEAVHLDSADINSDGAVNLLDALVIAQS